MALQGQAVYSRNDPDHPVPYDQVLPTVAYEPCICKETILSLSSSDHSFFGIYEMSTMVITFCVNATCVKDLQVVHSFMSKYHTNSACSTKCKISGISSLK